MKKLLFYLLLFAPAFLFAQSGEPVSDTSYFVQQGPQFYEVKTAIYQDGSELTTKTLIGDTTAMVESAKARLTSSAATMAVDIRHVSTFKKKFTTLVRESDQVKALTGVDPQRSVQEDYDDAFLVSGWKIRRDGTTNDVVFTVNAQGALRYAVAGGQTRAATLIGNAVRLNNYPSNGTDTDLFALPNGVWVNADRSIVLRPPGNNAPVNRAGGAPKGTTKG